MAWVWQRPTVHKRLSYRRGTARRVRSVEILSAAAQPNEKSHLRRRAIGEWPWRSLKVIGILPLFDKSYVTSYSWSVVTTSLSCTVSEILPLLQCTWLPVTLRSPSVLIRQLKSQYKQYSLSDSWVNISQLMRAAFFELLELETFQTAKATFKVIGIGAIR